MNLALKVYGINTVSINTEMIILDTYKRPSDVVLLSLVDAAAKVDKIRMDYKKKVALSTGLLNRDTGNYLEQANLNGIEYIVQKKPHGNLSHMMFYQNLKSPYIYHFNKEETIEELVLKKIVNTYFIPGNLELVKEIMKKNQKLYSDDLIDELIIRPLKIYSANESLNDIKAYKFSIKAYKETMKILAEEKGEEVDPIFYKLKNNFTEYIKTFKDNIIDNLFDKIETFYDPKKVPEYVTEFPRPLPDTKMKKTLEVISKKIYNKSLSELSLIESNVVYKKHSELKEKINNQNLGDWSKQYRIWAAGMEILKSEKFLYLSLIMGAGKTLSSLKINKYTCKNTLRKPNHVTFILCPQSTITQWIEEIKLIESGIGNTKNDYNVIVINKTSDIIKFYNEHSKIIKGTLKFDKKSIEKPTYILCGKEVFKLSQVQRPAFNIKIENEGKVKLVCPNCGEQLFYVKKTKRGESYIPMTLSDFFKSDKNGDLKVNKSGNFEKTLKKSNFTCVKCNENITKYNSYIRDKRNLDEESKNMIDEFDKKIFVSNDSKIWTYDYFTNDNIRKKIFNKLSFEELNNNSYTTFDNVNEMKEKINKILEIKKEMLNRFGLRNIYDNSKNKSKKISVVEFLRKRKFKFDSVIIDEAHEGNNADSIIGTAQRLLFKFSDKVILLSGTCNSGYASSLHNLLVSAMPNKLLQDGTFEKEKFISRYGILEKKIKVDDEYKLSGKVLQEKSGFKEVEGINPVVFTKFLSKNFIMVNSLEQLSLPMPELKEIYIPILLDGEVEVLYNNLIHETERVNSRQAKMLIASTFKNYVNNPYSWDKIEIQEMFSSNKVKIGVPTIKREKKEFLRKDYELLKIIKQEKSENRKCFLFTDFVEGGRYIIPEEFGETKAKKKITINDRIIKLLEENGIRCKIILSGNASAKDRKNYIMSIKDNYDVFICQPQLVNVGLNLVFCPTYIVYTPYYRYDIISQATRRGYRANSTEENRIYHLYYSDTCEETIINRYQRKLAEAKAIEGDFDVNIEKNKNIRTLSKMSNEILN